MFNHLMIDLETYGTVAGCPILSVGAVLFEPQTGSLGAEFYGVADKEQTQWGLLSEQETIKWWDDQSDEARQVLNDPAAMPLPLLLSSFSDWLGTVCDPSQVKVWGNGASFDNAILAMTYPLTGQELPWKFWNDRCYRTIKNLAPHMKLDRSGTHHNALDDAKSQTKHLMDIVMNTTITLA